MVMGALALLHLGAWTDYTICSYKLAPLGGALSMNPPSIGKAGINRNQGSALIDIMQAISRSVDNCAY
jgi:hypothetical protein